MSDVADDPEAEQVRQVLQSLGHEQMGDLAAKIEAAIGRSLPQVEVRFQGLSIAADIAIAEKSTPSHNAGKEELPTLLNVFKRGLVSKLPVKKRIERRQILHPMTGAFKSGTITLILGQPGSGKSSLLKILSGRFPMQKNVVVDGSVTYNGKLRRDLTRHIPQFVSYVNQHDKHFPTLTVKETLKFAHMCCGNEMTKKESAFFSKGGTAENETTLKLMQTITKFFPEVIIQQLGLQTCQDTIVGDAMIRGISGGQRKRVTTGEMQFGKKNVMLMDEISTGLDSAATFDIVNTQRALAKQFRKTTVISLLQPSPEVFGLFDDVLILNEGHIMYHGPREKVEGYFNSLGFVCPERRDVADFLLDLGTDQQAQYQVSVVQDASTTTLPKHPRTALEFADAFKRSDIFAATVASATAPMNTVLERDMKDYVTQKSEFAQCFMASTRLLMAREVIILKRNTMFLFGRVAMIVIMGILYGTTYYQFSPLEVQVVMGLLFSAVLFLSLGQMAQIPTIMEARDVFYKQRGANFYRTLSYVLAFSVSKIPMALGESIVFGTLVYWMCGFVNHGGAYVMFEILLILTNMAFTSWFFFVASASPNLHVAKPLSMVSILVFVLFAGFIITKDQLPVYAKWLYWIDPVAWCLRALAVNQYRDPSLDKCEYDGIDYCSLFGMKTGEYYLTLYGVPTEKAWVGYGLIFMILTYFAFMTISYLVLEYKRFETPELHGTVTQTDEAETADILSARTGSTIETGKNESVPQTGKASQKVSPVDRISVTPVTLAFNDIWYSVPDPSNPRETIDLLQGVTGYAPPGTMTALMGSSGAGKTTLMDVIAGRKTGGKIRGQILLNGHPASRLAIRRCTGYCEQMDIHSDASTVREALTFSAFLRLSSSVSDASKAAAVNECLHLLDLHPIADQIIRGSTTEQMKRVTIGVELAAQPSVLFLDEPTSGLDARSAKRIMDGVRRVADSGRTIVCTIHQPSSEVFQLFDRLLLLKRGGETVFYGDLGIECVNLIAYFEAISGVAAITHGYNPATWMLECIGAGVGSSGPQGGSPTNFAELFKKSELKTALDEEMKKDGVGLPSKEFAPITFSTTYASTPSTQMRLLVKRFFDMYWRTASYNLTRLAISILLALIFGIIFVGADYSTYQGINSGVGMIFVTTLFNAMVSFNSGLPIACEERASFYREQASQMYHPFWYFLGATLAEIPYVLASALLFCIVFLPMVGFPGFASGVVYWINVSLIILLMTYIGQFLAYAMPSLEVAMTAGALMSSIQGLFMGFNPPASSIPTAYKWIYHLTPQRYIMGNLVAIALGTCETPGGDDLGCATLKNAPVSLGTITVKQYVELVFAMKHADISKNVGIIIGFIVAFRLFAFLALRFINHQKR